MPRIPRALRILAVSGSLRSGSSNTELLRAAALLAPPGMRIVPFNGLGALPHFNPDLDRTPAPPAVTILRAQVASADGLLICSPEYAHGIPGALKNALDWLVSGVEIVAKPIGVLNASPRSTHAHEALIEVVRTLCADVVAGACVPVPLAGRHAHAAGILANPELVRVVQGALAALVEAAEGRTPALLDACT